MSYFREPKSSEQIRIDNRGTTLVVSGPYSEMQKILPRLKGLGFRYEVSNKSWWIPAKDLTPRKLTNLKKLIEKEPSNQSTKPEVNIDAAKQVLQDSFKQALVGFSFRREEPSYNYLLQGDTYDLRADIRSAGGEWRESSNAWLFSPESLDISRFEQVFSKIVRRSHENAIHVSKIEKLLSEPIVWTNLGVKIVFDKLNRVVVVKGNTRPLKDEIKNFLPKVTFQSPQWEVGRLATSVVEIESLIRRLDELETKGSPDIENAPVKVSPSPMPKRQENRRGDHCKRCGVWVPPGQGYLTQTVDYDDEDSVKYDVIHQDKEICDRNLTEAITRQEKAKTISQARLNLSRMSEKSEYYLVGTNLSPPGRTLMIDDRNIIYGSGTWVVIEPDERHFWWVRNNGSDGDMWDRNNVETGGAGAIGYRLPLTEELRVLIDVSVNGKSGLV